MHSLAIILTAYCTALGISHHNAWEVFILTYDLTWLASTSAPIPSEPAWKLVGSSHAGF